MITLDGSEGGGQLLRSALSLSLITGKPFRMTRIRGARPKPGLMRQHLACVHAAQQLGNAEVAGGEVRSQELSFTPGKIRAGDFSVAIGTGGSTTLVLQTLLPAMLYAPGACSVHIEGGTHNPMAPPFEFIEQCYLPMLHRMGAKVSATLERPGFMQTGGGALRAEVLPIKKWKPLKLMERGALIEHFGVILNAHLADNITQREHETAAKYLNWEREKIEVKIVNESTGPGNIVMLGARYDELTEISSAVAQMGRSAESVAMSAAKGLQHYLNNTGAVSVHLADQLLLPLALAGSGKFTTFGLSDHTRSSMALIPEFLDVEFEVKELELGVREIRVF